MALLDSFNDLAGEAKENVVENNEERKDAATEDANQENLPSSVTSRNMTTTTKTAHRNADATLVPSTPNSALTTRLKGKRKVTNSCH